MSGENKRPQCVKALPFKPNNPSLQCLQPAWLKERGISPSLASYPLTTHALQHTE